MLVSEQGGKLAISNLKSTLSASLAKFNVHIMCDDLAQRLIEKLEISIRERELHWRIPVPIQRQCTTSVIRSDLSHSITDTLFSAIRINVKQKRTGSLRSERFET